MTSFTVLATIVALLCCRIVSPFRFRLHDASAVIEGRANEALMLTLDIQISDMGSAAALSECGLCMALNGSTCHCYSAPMPELHPTLPADCVSSLTPHRMSLYMNCNGLITSSTSIYVPDSQLSPAIPPSQLTLVLPIELNDMPRFVILLKSLSLLTSESVLEMIVIVPDAQRQVFLLASRGFSPYLHFGIRVVPESDLLPPPPPGESYYPYAIQMALKLLACRIVMTDFYITLDADVVLLRNFEFNDIVRDGRGIYHHEPRLSVHPEWWVKSESFLGINSRIDAEQQGIGATPACLSTFGSMLVLNRIEETVVGAADFRQAWVASFGRSDVWSEYTLYRIVLDHYKVSSTSFHLYLFFNRFYHADIRLFALPRRC